MTLRFRQFLWHATGQFIILMAVAHTAYAQESAPQQEDQRALEEVVVTATKRGAAGIQDVNVAVSALGGDQLQESALLDLQDSFVQMPGLFLNQQGPGDNEYIIRGIQSVGEGTVSVYFDEVIITGQGEGDFGGQPDIKGFDLARVEALKGPQGTTFGSSSLAGSIRLIPNKPVFGQFLAEAGAATSKTRHSDDIGWRAEGMVNIPLGDTAALRVSGLKDFTPGYLDNVFEDDANSDDVWAARGILGWQITDELDLELMAMTQDREVDARNFFNDTQALLPLSDSLNGQPLPDHFQAVLTRGGFEDEIDMYSATMTWTNSLGTVTWTGSNYNRTLFRRRATSFASEILFGIPADDGGQAFLAREVDQERWTTELRFASEWDGPVQILLGAFADRNDRDELSPYTFTDPDTGRPDPSRPLGRLESITNEQDEIAIFGEVDWQVTDRFSVTAGARWFDFDIEFQEQSIIQFLSQPGTGFGPLNEFDESDTIFRFNAAYDLQRDVSAYFQFSQGFRAGGANDQSPESIPGITVDIPNGFGSDSLDNYEFGLKSRLFDQRLTLNIATFLMTWKDIQVEQQAQSEEGLSFSYRGNGGEAEVKGVEIDASVFPMDGLTVDGGLTFISAQLVEDFPIASNGRAGDRIPYTPKWTAFLNVRYERPITGELWGFAGANWFYRGEASNKIRSNAPFERTLEDHQITDLRVGVETPRWQVIARVNNVFDNDDITSYTFDFQFPPRPGEFFLPDNKVRPWPRTFELAFRYNF